MATTIDTLKVRLEADLSPLRRALKRSTDSVNKSSAKMKKSFAGIGASVSRLAKKFGGLKGLIGGAVVAALSAMAISIGKTGAEFQDLQKTLNIVFGGMEEGKAAMKFIQTFAQTTPFDIQTLSKAFIKLGGAGIQPTEKLLTTFGNVASSTTEKVAVFEAMVRLASRSVQGGLGIEELDQIADRGVDVYGMLSDEIGITRQQVSEFGKTAAGAKDITDALYRAIDRRFDGAMGDSLTNLSTATSNMKIGFTNLKLALGDGMGGGTGLTSAFTFLMDTLSQVFLVVKPFAHVIGSVLGVALKLATLVVRSFTESIIMLARGLVDIVKFFGDMLPDSFKKTKEALAKMDQDLSDLEEQMNRNIKPAADLVKENVKLTSVFKSQASALRVLRAQIAGVTKEEADALEKANLLSLVNFGDMSNPNNVVTFTDDGSKSAGEGTRRSVEAVRSAIAMIAGLQKEIDDAEEAQDNFNASSEKGADFAKDLANRHLGTKQAIIDVSNAYKAGLIDQDLYQAATERLKQSMSDLAPFMDELNSSVQDMSSSISEAFADAFLNGKNAMDSLKDVFKGFVKTLIAKAIELFFVNQILNAVFSSFGVPMLPTAQAFGPRRASGGSVGGGQPYMVGERGPELFVPHSGGTIRNAADSRGGGGATTVINQSISVETGVSQTVRAEMTSILPTFKQETMNAIVDAKRRGGSFGQAMG